MDKPFDFASMPNPWAAMGAQLAPGPSPASMFPAFSAALDPEQIEKNLQSLKHVKAWLDQQSSVAGMAIQALEAQKMALSALSAMKVDVGAWAKELGVQGAPVEGWFDPMKMWEQNLAMFGQVAGSVASAKPAAEAQDEKKNSKKA